MPLCVRKTLSGRNLTRPPGAGWHLEDKKNSKRRAIGWRRSADRTRLHANSLLTGNFTGNFAISGLQDAVSTQEAAVPQPLLAQFPTRINRENISKNR